jgi:hypothetical protein
MGVSIGEFIGSDLRPRHVRALEDVTKRLAEAATALSEAGFTPYSLLADSPAELAHTPRQGSFHANSADGRRAMEVSVLRSCACYVVPLFGIQFVKEGETSYGPTRGIRGLEPLTEAARVVLGRKWTNDCVALLNDEPAQRGRGLLDWLDAERARVG